MRRFFENSTDSKVKLSSQNALHVHALRLKAGEQIILSDGTGNEAVYFLSFCDGNVFAEYVHAANPVRNSGITIFHSVLKGDKTELVIQKCAELGAAVLVPFISERTVAVPKDFAAKTVRFRKIAEEACKQCGRAFFPEVRQITTLEDCIKDAALFDGDVAVCYENEKNLSLKSWAADKKGNIAVFVGAEGGFSAKEIEMFTEKNIPVVTLGNLILRAETAAIAVAAFFCLT